MLVFVHVFVFVCVMCCALLACQDATDGELSLRSATSEETLVEASGDTYCRANHSNFFRKGAKD